MTRTAEKLLTRIRRNRQESRSSPFVGSCERIELGDFQIDLQARTATLGGRELHLDHAEFDLLVFLVGHPKQLVTPQTMLATRWPERGARQSQFVRILMSLRSKLEACGSAKHYLRTEPWIFYRFDPNAL